MIPPRRAASVAIALALLAGTIPAALAAVQINWTKGQVFAYPLGLPGSSAKLSSGSLPPGLNLATIATVPNINGTPTTAGKYSFTIQVTPLVGSPTTTTYDMTIAEPPQIDQDALPEARVGEPYSASVTITGGTAPVTFSPVLSGLPPGLGFEVSTGAVTGTPTTAGTYRFTVQATDLALVSDSREIAIEVTEGPRLEATGTTVWTVGRPGFAFRVTATGGSAPIAWEDPTGVPPGLSWSREGDVLTVSGTPDQTGQSRFSVTVRDALDSEATLERTLLVNAAPSIETAELPDATLGAGYGAAVAARDGTPDHSFRIVSATAGWLSIDPATGTLSGIPGAVGPVTVRVEVQDATGAAAEAELGFEVRPRPQLPDEPLPIAVVDTPYSADLAATGGTAPLTFTVVSGRLPSGLRIADGSVAGTPTEPGDFDVTVEVGDRWGATATRDVPLLVGRPLPVKTKLPVTEVGAGSREAFVFDVIAGTTLTVALKAPAGTDDLTVRALLLDGTPIDLVPFTKLGRTSIRLKKVPVERTGRFALVLENTGDQTLAVAGKASGKPPKTTRLLLGWGPGSGEREVEFAALEGARITVLAKSRGRDVPAAELVSLAGPEGEPVDTVPFAKRVNGGFKISRLAAASGGDHVLRYRPSADGASEGTLKLTVRIKSPKQYVFSAPR